MNATAFVSKRKDSPVPDGEFPFTWSDFREIATLVHSESGIVLQENKVNLVYSRLAKRIRAIGLESFRQYCDLVQSESGDGERQNMIAAMTTNVTKFFREEHHFDFLRDDILPDLIQAARAGKRVRIWSSACSSGEEPYSIAMTLLTSMPDALERDVLILASDLDPNMIQRGKDGIYESKQIAGVPAAYKRDWLEPVSGKTGSVRVAEKLRKLIRFNQLNLLGSWPMKGHFDAIFCRNVMIYFDEPTQDAIWKRFAGLMNKKSTLFIGHSERIAMDRHPFELVAQTTYRLR